MDNGRTLLSALSLYGQSLEQNGSWLRAALSSCGNLSAGSRGSWAAVVLTLHCGMETQSFDHRRALFALSEPALPVQFFRRARNCVHNRDIDLSDHGGDYFLLNLPMDDTERGSAASPPPWIGVRKVFSVDIAYRSTMEELQRAGDRHCRRGCFSSTLCTCDLVSNRCSRFRGCPLDEGFGLAAYLY